MTLEAKNERFSYSLGRDEKEQYTQYVTGYYRAHWLEWNPGWGNPGDKNSIPPRWELMVEIDEATAAGANPGESAHLGSVRLEVGPTTAARILAAQILKIDPNDYVGITARRMGDATLTELATWDGQTWSHKFADKNREGTSPEERTHETFVAIQSHPGWRKPAITKRARQNVVEPPLPSGPYVPGQAASSQPRTKARPASSFSGSAEGGANPAQTSAREAKPAPQVLYNVRLTRVPLDKHWEQEPTERQLADFPALLETLGIHEWQEEILEAIARAFDRSGRGKSLAGYAIASDVLKNEVANVDALMAVAEAIYDEGQEGAGHSSSADDEYDPFAEE